MLNNITIKECELNLQQDITATIRIDKHWGEDMEVLEIELSCVAARNWQFLKKSEYTYHIINDSTCKYLSKRNESVLPYKNLVLKIHTPDLKITQIPFNRWMGKKILGFTYNVTLFKKKKKWNIKIHYNKNETQNNCMS